MKKILSLLCLLMLAMTSAWAGEVATYDLGTKNGVSTPGGFFKSVGEKWSWNTKFTGGEYDGMSFTQGLKMESTTKIGFTTTEVSTVTIVQSTYNANTIKLDDVELAVADAEAGTGCRIYTVSEVAAGDHVIARGNGESGLFYVKVEWETTKTVTFINDANWETVNVYAWDKDNKPVTDEWPGTTLTEKDLEGNYIWSTKADPIGILFNNGSAQTTDQVFKDGGVYNSTGRIITLNDYSATFKTDGMDEVWAYAWNGDEKALGDWPGTKMEGGNGEFSIAIKAEEAPKFIIFHNNAGDQTPDWEFEDGKAYEYNLNEYSATFTYISSSVWENVYAYAWSGEGDNVKEFAGAWPGTQLTLSGDAYAFSCKAFNAPEKIIFNSGSNENQTADLPFINGKAYKWNTTTPFYALKEGDTFAAGTTVDLTAATITYGVDGGADFGAAYAAVNEDYAGFAFMTGGNGENGSIDGGTVYTIVPKYEGIITIGVRLNGNKAMHINEDGTDMEGFNGYKIAEAANTTFSFDVKAGSTYKIWCDGSKLGFFGFDYSYAAPVAGTSTFDFTDPNFRENIGEAMTDTKGYIYNETFTVNSTTLQITSGSAPSRIYVDNNRGQNLVTYTQYATLTFRAPEGKAITKIEFTAAGNSNINKLEPSSGAIEGMVWTGNADGVRFMQGGTSYLANAIVTLADKDGATAALPAIAYTECANIAAFNALEAGTYAKLTLTDAEVTGKSADGYSTVWVQDATGGAWIQYTSLNANLQEMTKLNGTVFTIKRATSGNPQLKEAEDTPKSEINAETISALTIIEGNTIAEVNIPENLNRVVKLSGATLEETSNTAGTLTLGDEIISVNNGNATANQQLCKIADWAKDTKLENVTIVAILAAKSATENVLYPISIELEGETVAEETLNVERYPEMGYTTTEATVDFTAAKTFLGVEELTSDMLVIVNPDNTEVGATSTDGWFNGEGYAETWGENTKINVKFFQAIPDGIYTICDMNGADEIGNTYTTKWALKANGKSYIYNINVTFVEKPVVELAYDALTIVGTEEEQFEWEVGTCYQDGTATIDVASILNTLNVESLDDVTIYAVQSDGSLDDMYQLGTTDGWRNADGDWQSWGADAYFYVKANFAAEDTQLYSVGTMDPATNTNLANAAEFTARYVFVKNGSTDAVQLNVVVALTEPEPVAITFADLNVLIEQEVSFTFEGGAYQGATADVDVNAILGTLGVESLDDVAIYAVQSNGTLDSNYKLGTTDGWRNENGDWQGWGSDAYFCVKTDFELESGQITYVGTMDGQNDPNTFVAKFVFVKDNETHDAVVLNVIIYYGDLTDGINAVNAKNLDNQVIYNLQGVRLEKLQKGLNIVGGKKVVIK